MVQKTHFATQTSLLVPLSSGPSFSNQRKTNRLPAIRLSPQFSPRFPCTGCGKPVPTYRRLLLLWSFVPLRFTARWSARLPWLSLPLDWRLFGRPHPRGL